MIVRKYFPAFVDHDDSEVREVREARVERADEALQIPWLQHTGGELYLDAHYVMTKLPDGERWVVALLCVEDGPYLNITYPTSTTTDPEVKKAQDDALKRSMQRLTPEEFRRLYECDWPMTWPERGKP